MKKSSQKGLILAFLFITTIIVFLWFISLYSLRENSNAIDNALHDSRLVRLAKEGTINLAMAGQLPRDIEAITTDTSPLYEKMEVLQEKFQSIKNEYEKTGLRDEDQVLVDAFVLNGEKFYQALAQFFPLKEELAVYFTHYKGESRTLDEVLSERELDHISYVRALRRSVVQKKLLVGTLDYKSCGFYKWYNSALPEHEDISEIILEEMHPLHQNLHSYAAEVMTLIRNGNYQEAEKALQKADDELVRLGSLFSGLRNLVHEEQIRIKKVFANQLIELRTIYDMTSKASNDLEYHLFNIGLQPALHTLNSTTQKNKTLIWIFSIIGTTLSVIFGLTNYFKVKNRTEELIDLTETLHQTKDEIAQQRNELQNAFNEVSNLIQEVALNQKFDIRFFNPHLVRCYEMMHCSQEACCCYGEAPARCWQIVGTLCGGEVQGLFAQKSTRCINCEVFQTATDDPVFLIGEYFNNMMTMLEIKNQEVESLSVTDLLTDLYNRRGFLSMGSKQLGMAQRTKGDILLLFADLDNMKLINDKFGHQVGDKALQETADVLRKAFRQTDIIGRLGGDEFAVLLFCETTDLAKCQDIVIKRFDDTLQELNNQNNRAYKLSISIGLAWFDRENPVHISTLLSEADQLMYADKKRKKDAENKSS